MRKIYKDERGPRRDYYYYTRVRIPKGLGVLLERAHEKYYPKMFETVSDFSVFVLREWIGEMINKDPELAEGIDFTDFY